MRQLSVLMVVIMAMINLTFFTFIILNNIIILEMLCYFLSNQL